MKNKKTILLTIVSLVLIINLIGCEKVDSSWIAEYKGEKVKVGEYIKYMMDGYEQLYIKDLMGETTVAGEEKEKVNKQGISGERDNEENKKEKKISILRKIIEDKEGSQWIIDEAKKSVAKGIAVNNKMAELGLKIDQAELEYIEKNINNGWDTYNEQYGYEKKGISKEAYLEILKTQINKQKIFNKYYGKDGINEVTEDQIKEYLGKEYNKVKYYSFELYGLNDEDKAKKKGMYEEFLNRAKSGEKIEDLSKEFNEKQKREEDIQEKNDEKIEGIDLEDIDEINEEGSKEQDTELIFKKDAGQNLAQDLKKAIEEAKFGVVTGYEGENELAIFIKQDPSDSKKYIEENKDMLISEMKADEFEKEIDTWINKDEIKYNESAINKYTPSKLKLDKENSKKS